MMERLDGPLADLVAAERDEMEAVPRSADAAWASIAAGWQPGPPPVPTPPAGAAEAAAASKGAALKVLGALVVGSSIAGGAWVAGQRSDPAPVALVQPPVVEPEPSSPPPVPEVPVIAPAPATPKPEPEPEPATPQPKPKPRAPAPGLAEELALVDAMRKDVAAGRYAAALARAAEHRRTFAKGRLAADRLDLEAAAKCGRGDVADGRALAERKAKRWPRAPISERLRSLCGLKR